jgi:hypothetical protein
MGLIATYAIETTTSFGPGVMMLRATGWSVRTLQRQSEWFERDEKDREAKSEPQWNTTNTRGFPKSRPTAAIMISDEASATVVVAV